MTTQPLPDEHFTPDGVFVFVPQNREVAMGLKPYRPNGPERLSIVFFALLAFFLFGLVVLCSELLPSTVGAWNRYFRLRGSQATTTAQVVDLNSRSVGDGIQYSIICAFTHPDRNGEPQQYTSEVNVSSGEFWRLRRGQTVTVYFVPDDPTIAQLTTPSIVDPIIAPLHIVSLNGLFGIGFLLGGSGITTFLLIRSLSRERRLTRHGQLLRGTLTYIERFRASDGDEYVEARYQFQSPQGIPLEGKNRATLNHFKKLFFTAARHTRRRVVCG